MYNIPCILSGTFIELSTNDIWEFFESHCEYIGNGVYIAYLHLQVFNPTFEFTNEEIMPIFVKRNNVQFGMEE